MGMWGEYVSVRVRQQQAKKQMEKLQKQGKSVEPIVIEGRTIARQFWGKKWCDHIESFADYSNRLPRGRTYVRNGSICHLGVAEGQVDAIVSGSSLYNVSIRIKVLAKDKWDSLKKKCSGMIGSILELLQGKISKNVMEHVVDMKEGLLPLSGEISYSCSCPDWAGMCKHVAAVLYGIGNRFDQCPELLFRLRGVDPQELVCMPVQFVSSSSEHVLQDDQLGELFGIDLAGNQAPVTPPVVTVQPASKSKSRGRKGSFNVDAVTGKVIKSLRTKAKLTVAEFAKELEVTPATIYRWEKIEEIISLKMQFKKALERVAKMTIS